SWMKGRRMMRATLFLVLLGTTLMAQVPRSRHVWIITEENHSYENAAASMPYLMSLASQYGLATQSYADTHNSLSTLMHLTAGETITLDDNTTLFFDVDNIVRQLMIHGLTWRSYQESIPHAGFEGIAAYPYVKRHDPLAYFSDTNTSSEALNAVPYPANIATDMGANYNYVTPNLLDDAHDGTMQAADNWLRTHIPAILARPEFQPGGDGIMIVTFDEGNLGSDNRCSATVMQGCGGHILTVVIGPQVKRGFKSAHWYNHESVLKTACVALGITSCPGLANAAAPMDDFFGNNALHVQILSPLPGPNVITSPAHFQIQAVAGAHPVSAIIVYSDDHEIYRTYSNHADALINLPIGSHRIVANTWDSSGVLAQAREIITVGK
ncbi:MAG TPA: alkaline phosphatase family protein, partial [Aggregatilineales bacterium]|nr:alkaline phosphatase family protein [Aggregatilineales bacterium]